MEEFLVPAKKDIKDYPALAKKVAERIRKIEQIALKQNSDYQAKYKARLDKNARKIHFKPGDLVMRKIERHEAGTCKGFAAQYDGPHRIVYVPLEGSSVMVRLFDDLTAGGKYDKFSVDKLKPYNPPLVLEGEVFHIFLSQC